VEVPVRKLPIEPLASAYRLLNPGVVVLVTVGDAEHDNLFPVSWNMPVQRDPGMVALCVDTAHYSYPFIERTGELGLSVPDESLLDAVYTAGTVSGADVADKFARCGLRRARPQVIGAPLVDDAVAVLECRVTRRIDLDGAALVLAKVVFAAADPVHFRDGSWVFDQHLRLLHHLGGDRFCVSDRVVHAQRS
jgi:flavin reductase (DIM6/NTAB) family NADH-FMN oxidoreductase RutF